jgi:hypothetical protein
MFIKRSLKARINMTTLDRLAAQPNRFSVVQISWKLEGTHAKYFRINYIKQIVKYCGKDCRVSPDDSRAFRIEPGHF